MIAMRKTAGFQALLRRALKRVKRIRKFDTIVKKQLVRRSIFRVSVGRPVPAYKAGRKTPGEMSR